MGASRHESLRIITRAHMPASQRKVELGRLHLGSAEPQVLPNLDAFLAGSILAGRSS
jgi:hypothetical protein